MVSHQQRAMVANLSMHKLLRQRQAHRFVARQAELFHPQEYILQCVSARDAVKPAAHREVSDGNLLLAKRLNGLRRNLNVAEQRHVREFAQPHFLDELVFVFHLQNLALAPDTKALGVQIKRTGVISRGNQSPGRRWSVRGLKRPSVSLLFKPHALTLRRFNAFMRPQKHPGFVRQTDRRE